MLYVDIGRKGALDYYYEKYRSCDLKEISNQTKCCLRQVLVVVTR